MENKYFYRTEVEWTGERHGDLRAPVLPNLHVDAPPEFKGHDGVWTPEHLFVASVNTCFMTTFLAIAENSKLEVVSFKADAKGKLEKLDGQGFMMTEITSSQAGHQPCSRCRTCESNFGKGGEALSDLQLDQN